MLYETRRMPAGSRRVSQSLDPSYKTCIYCQHRQGCRHRTCRLRTNPSNLTRHSAGEEGETHFACGFPTMTQLESARQGTITPEMHYVAKREEMIRYPEFQAKGWQIGSGPTEAMCKTTTARLKGSGMRWDADNAEAVMALDALEQSGEWKLYWRSQLRPTG